MYLNRLRPVLLMLATTVLAAFLVACARLETVMPFKDDPVEALCWRILSPISEFQDAITNSGTGEPEVVVRQSRTAAKSVEAAIEISRRQDAQFSDFERAWIEGLDLAAQAYVEISDGGLASLTDEEAVIALTNINQWFKYAADQCVGTQA